MPQLRAKSQLKANLDLWLNNLLLRDGYYNTVSNGELDVYSRDISQLSAQSSPDYPDNMVYQSAFKNWVHESGISAAYAGISPPIVSSGVVVNGTFYPKDPSAPGYNAAFAHAIDYPNGRVIFSSPISPASTVRGVFSYKEVAVDFGDTFENEQKEFYFETAYKDNPYQTGVMIYPQENSRTLPLIVIDITSRNNEGYELGSASNVAEFRGSFHVWARDIASLDMIEDLIMQNEREVLIGINFNTAPMPIQYNGDKNPSFTTYSQYATLTSPYLFKRIYIDELNTVKIPPYYNIERVRIDFLARIYPNF
jgi:hypothetical protein